MQRVWNRTFSRGGGGGVGGAGTFLMEHMPKSLKVPKRWVGVFRIFRKVPNSTFLSQKRKRGTPSNI